MPAKASQLDLVSLPQMCKAICLPGDYSPVRFPTYPSVERTSVLPFNSTATVVVPPSGMRGLLLKSATMPLWLDIVASTPYSWCANWDPPYAASTPVAGNESYMFPRTMKEAYSGNIGPFSTGVQVIGSSYLPAQNCPLGEFGGVPHVYAPTGSCVTFIVSSAQASSGFGYLAYESVAFGTTPATSNVQMTSLATGNGWYATIPMSSTLFIRPVSFTHSAATSLSGVTMIVGNCNAITLSGKTVSFVGQPVNPVLVPMSKPPALNVSAVPYSNSRATAIAALFTNVTKVLNKEGTVIAGRFNPMYNNVFDTTMQDFSLLSPLEKYFFGLEKGFYTYVPPQTDPDEFATDVWSPMTAPYVIPWVHLDHTALVSCFRFDDPDGGTSLAVNLDWHVEFRNASVLWPVAISSVSLEQAHQAQLVCLEAGFFFDNVDHRQILSMVSKGIGYVQPILRMMGHTALSSGVGKLKNMINAYVQPSGPKPTTLLVREKPVRVKGGKKDRERKKDKQVSKGKNKKK